MGLNTTKPVFRVSDKERLKPVSSATETGKKIKKIVFSKIRYDTFQLVKNKGVDQTAHLRRLVSAIVVPKH